jgi:hypothetical protein
VWRAIFLITMASVLEKILDKEPVPIPKPEIWTQAMDALFRQLLGKQKCFWQLFTDDDDSPTTLALRPENINTFQLTFKNTPLEHSTIAAEIICWLNKSQENYVRFRR